MQLTVGLPYARSPRQAAGDVAELEQAGLDMVWVAEAYGFDAFSIAGYLACATERIQIATGIVPVFTRTPSLIAMSAAAVDALSEGRFQLGLGASGPQVIEGWHGVPYDSPLGRTREVTEICRAIWAREAPVRYQGRHYALPLPPERGTGLAKPLKIINHPVRPSIPVWMAALGTRNVEMAAELADGWLPMFFVADRAQEVWGEALATGLGRRAPERGTLQIAAGGLLAIGEGDEVRAVRDQARPNAALYIGGMGARGRNFYNDLVCRYGYEAEAKEIQDLYLDGRTEEAAALVPEALLESITLCGSAGYVRDRISALAEAGVTHLKVTPVPVGDQVAADVIAAAAELCHG